MREIVDRSDVFNLVNTFYTKVRKHKDLGPIFNHHIAEEEWPHHLEKLTDFWESNLFGVRKFKGNPTLKHIAVDEALPKGIEQELFGFWLQLWMSTLDELFEGERAQRAKDIARSIGHVQFMMLWRRRQQSAQNTTLNEDV